MLALSYNEWQTRSTLKVRTSIGFTLPPTVVNLESFPKRIEEESMYLWSQRGTRPFGRFVTFYDTLI